MGILKNTEIFVTTLHKYQSFNHKGSYLKPAEYKTSNDFLRACHDAHNDEEEPVFMFTDWENMPDELIDTYHLDETFFSLRDELDKMPDEKAEGFMAWIAYCNYDIRKFNIDALIEDFNEIFIGRYETEEDFAYEYVKQKTDLPVWVTAYFNYTRLAETLFSTDYIFYDCFVFRN